MLWHSRLTLKPYSPGNSSKRRFSNVLLPTPEGPHRTTGRDLSTTDEDDAVGAEDAIADVVK